MHRQPSVAKDKGRSMMKAITTKMIVSLTGILLVTPFLAVALIVGARAVAPAHSSQDDLLLVALTLVGVAAGILNNRGQGMTKEKGTTSRRVEAQSTNRKH